MRCQRVWTNARLATLIPGAPGLGEVDRGVVAAGSDGEILYAGPLSEAPALDACKITDCEGRWITPGLIDPHTHLVHAGDRAHEFELRLAGASYEAIARAGGGIVSTVAATRAASEGAARRPGASASGRAAGEGVTTIEVKSGYGLTLDDELKQLRAARALGQVRDVEVAATLLGAHALPPEFRGDPTATSTSSAGR